jgi:hypothetical protein
MQQLHQKLGKQQGEKYYEKGGQKSCKQKKMEKGPRKVKEWYHRCTGMQTNQTVKEAHNMSSSRHNRHAVAVAVS